MPRGGLTSAEADFSGAKLKVLSPVGSVESETPRLLKEKRSREVDGDVGLFMMQKGAVLRSGSGNGEERAAEEATPEVDSLHTVTGKETQQSLTLGVSVCSGFTQNEGKCLCSQECGLRAWLPRNAVAAVFCACGRFSHASLGMEHAPGFSRDGEEIACVRDVNTAELAGTRSSLL